MQQLLFSSFFTTSSSPSLLQQSLCMVLCHVSLPYCCIVDFKRTLLLSSNSACSYIFSIQFLSYSIFHSIPLTCRPIHLSHSSMMTYCWPYCKRLLMLLIKVQFFLTFVQYSSKTHKGCFYILMVKEASMLFLYIDSWMVKTGIGWVMSNQALKECLCTQKLFILATPECWKWHNLLFLTFVCQMSWSQICSSGCVYLQLKVRGIWLSSLLSTLFTGNFY